MKPETVAPALRGVTGLLLMRPPALSDVKQYLKPVVEAAVASGVGHMVFLSLQGAQYNPFVPHHKVENYIKDSGVRYSFLRPSFFMQNLSGALRDDIRLRDQLLLPAGHARTSFVDAEDVGAVAAQLLLAPPAASAGYELTSHEALTYDKIAAQLTEVLGRPIRYHAAGIWEFRAYERAKGTPVALVNVMTGIYLAARFGLAAHVSPVLSELLGRAPGTLRAFLERERACWVPEVGWVAPFPGHNRQLVASAWFVVTGLACLLVTLFLLGRKQNLFSRSMTVQADFQNVSGLLTGNNVRLGGITVGTVKQIKILNDTTVRVEMSLNRDVRPFVRRNAVAVIGTDGLVGNTIINLTAGAGAAPLVNPGDILPTRTPAGIDAMLGTLDISNKNLVGITQNLRQITGRLNGDNALWKLLDDEQLTANVRTSLQNVAAASAQLSAASHDVQDLTRRVRQGRGPAGYLLTDTAFASRLGHAARQLAGTSDTLAVTLATLKRQVQTDNGPLNTLLTDTVLSRQLRQSVRNVETGTAGFSQNMEALQHNFLLRGYFRRQAKKQAGAAVR